MLWRNIILTILLVYTAVPSIAWGANFERNLRQGDIGADVKALQMLLNRSSLTRVAQSGDGSPGYETNYFGARTASAVKRLQELYGPIILAPVGLSYGTGFFGPSTRAFLEPVLVNSSTQPLIDTEVIGEITFAVPTATARLLPPVNVSGPVIESLTPIVIGDGDEVTIHGKNFSPTGNDVYSLFSTIKDVASADGVTLTFVFHLDPQFQFSLLPVELKLQVPTENFFIVSNNIGTSATSSNSIFKLKI